MWGLRTGTDGPRLRSTASGFHASVPRWPPFERFSAECLALRTCPADRTPDATHTCGIYAVTDLDRARAWGRTLGIRPLVVGRVRGWGRVIETADGWRAQYAYPESFLELIMPRMPWMHAPRVSLEELTATYGIA